MSDFSILPEQEHHAGAIHALHEAAFGPGRFARAAFRLREQGGHCPVLSLVALDPEGDLLGSVRMTRIVAGGEGAGPAVEGLLLGPLAVAQRVKNVGIGKALVRAALAAARDEGVADYALLVGDQPYYGPLGFARVPAGQLRMPGPVDASRLLVCPLKPGFSGDRCAGLVRHAGRV